MGVEGRRQRGREEPLEFRIFKITILLTQLNVWWQTLHRFARNPFKRISTLRFHFRLMQLISSRSANVDSSLELNEATSNRPIPLDSNEKYCLFWDVLCVSNHIWSQSLSFTSSYAVQALRLLATVAALLPLLSLLSICFRLSYFSTACIAMESVEKNFFLFTNTQ